MKSKVLILLLAFAIAATYAFAGGQKPEPAGPAPEAPPKHFQLVWTAVSVPDDAHTKAMYQFKNELERITDGQIEVELYHSGQLFNQEAAQAAVGPPVLGQLDRGARQVAVLLELGLEEFEQRERVGGAAGKAREDLVVI